MELALKGSANTYNANCNDSMRIESKLAEGTVTVFVLFSINFSVNFM